MKRLRTLTGLLAICGASVFMTGCGGDDSNDGGSTGPTQNAPNAVGGTYTLTDSTGASTLTLASSGTSYTLARAGSATESGNYQASRSGDVWTVLTTTDDLTTTRTVTLTFSGPSAGSFTVEQAGQPTVTGNFTRASDPGNTTNTTGDGSNTTTNGDNTTTNGDNTTTNGDNTTTNGDNTTTNGDNTTTNGDNTTTTDGTTDGGTTGSPGTVPAPAALQRVNITNTTSGTGPSSYTVELNGTTSGTFMITSGSVGQGTFTYTPSGNSARLVMSYTDFPGDSDDLTLNFQAASGSDSPSNHNGTQVVSGTTYPISGTFTYVAR